eukprot:Em0014g703a
MWSNPIRLKDYDDAPDEPGVYEIGFFRSESFNPMYLGMSEKSICNRLSAHYRGDGNEEVDHYITEAERDNLYCRWSRVEAPRCKEAKLLRQREHGKYEWNKRNEPQCDALGQRGQHLLSWMLKEGIAGLVGGSNYWNPETGERDEKKKILGIVQRKKDMFSKMDEMVSSDYNKEDDLVLVAGDGGYCEALQSLMHNNDQHNSNKVEKVYVAFWGNCGIQLKHFRDVVFLKLGPHLKYLEHKDSPSKYNCVFQAGTTRETAHSCARYSCARGYM